MTKKEQVLQRQMKLFQLIKDWQGRFILSDAKILEMMPESYSTTKTIRRDVETLKQRFLISSKTIFLSPSKSIREIKVINKNKELLKQCNYEYLEALALANPHCFLIKWRVGYEYHEGGIQKYLDEKCPSTIIGNKWHNTGIWLLKEPSTLLSSKPIKYTKIEEVNSEDYKSWLDTRELAF